MKLILESPEREDVVIPYHPTFIQQAVNASFIQTGLRWKKNGREMHEHPALYISRSLRERLTSNLEEMPGKDLTITGLMYVETFGEEGAAGFQDELAYMAGGHKEQSRKVKLIADQIMFKIGLLEDESLDQISGMTNFHLGYAQQAYKRFSHTKYDVFDMMSRFVVAYTRALRFLKTDILKDKEYVNNLMQYCEEEDVMLGKNNVNNLIDVRLNKKNKKILLS